MSSDATRTFTKNGDVKIDFKKIMEHNWFKKHFNSAYRTEKAFFIVCRRKNEKCNRIRFGRNY